MNLMLRSQSPVGIGKVAWLHAPGQWGNAGMHSRRERRRVDVVLQDDHLQAQHSSWGVSAGAWPQTSGVSLQIVPKLNLC